MKTSIILLTVTLMCSVCKGQSVEDSAILSFYLRSQTEKFDSITNRMDRDTLKVTAYKNGKVVDSIMYKQPELNTGNNIAVTDFGTYQQFSIVDTNQIEVFHYSTMDSVLIVKDSLRTIKWLISLVIEDMKKHDWLSSWQELSLSDTGKTENWYDMEDGGDGINVFDNPTYDSTELNDYEGSFNNIYIGTDTGKIYFDSVTIYGNEPPVYHRKKDTIPVILLVCDTLTYNHGYTELAGTKTIIPGNHKQEARWQYGYSVREQHYYNEDMPIMPSGGMFTQESTFWKHLYYLDKNKKELGKNIIIWQTKEIGKPSLK